MDTIKFDLVTPEATFFSGQASQIDIPGTEGDFGVLPGHSAVISTMRTGVVKIYTAKEEIKRVFVASGIAEVNAASCTILAERVMDLDSITCADAEKALAKAREVLDRTVDEPAKTDAVYEANLAEALVFALS